MTVWLLVGCVAGFSIGFVLCALLASDTIAELRAERLALCRAVSEDVMRWVLARRNDEGDTV